MNALPDTKTTNAWMDSPRRYGRISRILHWGMALLFVWMFAGMIFKITLGWNPRDSWMLGTHSHVGFLLLVLLIVRAIWALVNIKQRPDHGTGFIARSAAAGHAVLYLLMFCVPFVALLRAYGSGRGFTWFNAIPIIPAGVQDPTLVQLVNSTRDVFGMSLHGFLAWLLLAIIVGHVGMVIVHHVLWKDDTLHKMAGPRLK